MCPYYLVDDTRRSTPVEMETMDALRRRLALDFPETADRLLPTRYMRVAELLPDSEIEASFDRIVRRSFMGDQYAWLARFCRQHGVEDVELSVEKTAHGAHAVLESFLEEVDSGFGYPTFRFAASKQNTDEYRVFSRFSFPLFDTTKLEMAEMVKARGWSDLMSMTWFCHRPRADRQPCGCCNPCLYAIEQGMGWRIPPRRRALAAVYRVTVKPLKQVVKNALRQTGGDRSAHNAQA